MVPCTFYYRRHTGVTDSKTLTDLAVDIQGTACCTVKTGISAQCKVRTGFGRRDNNTSAVHSFTDIVVSCTVHIDRNSFTEESTERLSRYAFDIQSDSIFGQTFVSVYGSNFSGNSGTETSVQVGDLFVQHDRFGRIFDRRHQLVNNGFFIFIFIIRFVGRYLTGVDTRYFIQKAFKVEFFGKFVIDDFQQFILSYDLFDRSVTQRSKDLTNIFCKQGKVVDNFLHISFETCPEMRILCCNPYTAGIEVADTQHDTSDKHKRTGTESILFRTEDRCFDNIQSGFEPAVRLYGHLSSKVIGFE
ncbi:TC3_70K14.5 [hydrothermal vent metagenome]|uniref:TC3_70K14.5 n=1 Tax=hydrothermal vent metagenome TaxID=652676 RepID=A0A1W1CJD9_9ZZZZ